MERIKVGIIGMGFIGACHMDALWRTKEAELIAITDADYETAQRFAKEYGIPKCYRTVEELLEDPEIQSVHNCTPNHLHLEINKKAILAGKHIFSEKPLGLNSQETGEMLRLLHKHDHIVAGVDFCYRMNPLIFEAKERIHSGELGRPLLVHGSFLQDWLLYETDYNWRIEARYSGESRCVADIGSHWMDLAQTILSSKILEVCSDTVIAYPTRKKSLSSAKTFEKSDSDNYVNMMVDTEDYAGVLLKFENGITGIFQCSQVSAGKKCDIDIEIDGTLASFQWQESTPDHMWKGNRDRSNELIIRNPNLMTEYGRLYTSLPVGHPEGWNDALRNNLTAFYRFIKEGKKQKEYPCDFATFEDGHYLMRVTEAIIKSSKERRWVRIDEINN